MPQSMSIGTGVVLDSSAPNYAPLSSTNTAVIGYVFRTHNATAFSAQILTDGLSVVNWQLQVTNIPATFGRAVNANILGSVGKRDDSAASNMWSNVTTGTISKGTGPQGAVAVCANSCHVDARLVLTYDPSNSGTTSAYYAAMRNTGT